MLACLWQLVYIFLSSSYFNRENVSWICILGALRFAGKSFYKYNGLTLEEFAIAFIAFEILTLRWLKFESERFYYEAVKPSLDSKESEELKKKW